MTRSDDPEPSSEPARADAPSRLPRTLAPLAIPAFRTQWASDVAVAIATDMEVIILGWYVLTETRSVVLLTLFGALHFFGTVTAPFIGVLGDRLGFRRLLVIMRSIYVALTIAMTTLVVIGRLSPAAVFALAILMALVRPSDMSVRTAFAAQLMPASLITGAIGISRSTADVARIIGALSGAALFAMLGMKAAYAGVLALYAMGLLLTIVASRRAAPAPQNTLAAKRRSPWRELAEGVGYVWNTPHLLAGMWLAVVANLTAFPLTGGLMPYVARDVYGLGTNGLGMLVASFAAGALVGSITVSALARLLRLGRTVLFGSVVWHLLLLGFIHAPGPAVGAMFLALAGFAQSLCIVALAAMLLRTAEPRYHGRVMGVRMLSTYSLPIGLVLLGALIERIGFVPVASSWLLLGIALTLITALGWQRALWRADSPANAR